MEPAPLHADVADGPEGGAAHWLTTQDGTRVRVAHWPTGGRGTVLLFPGRTEYVEKYGRVAREFGARGFSTIAIDWRGQGLADRMLDDPLSGHVMHFSDYQQDASAMLRAARGLGLPEPFHLVAHSMGGCIGLRALMEGLPVRSAMFSAPMWGIRLAPAIRPLAWSLSWGLRAVGLDHRYAPGTSANTVVGASPFDENSLTSDRDSFDYMVAQVQTYPDLSLGGPSMRWLYEALKETRALDARPSPDLPTTTFVGTDETIVDVDRIHARMKRWPGGRLEVASAARHEIMMEVPATRQRFFNAAAAQFLHAQEVEPA
ncbi:alpha/beta fold hydrolase [Tranquillimonas alkanivorans]|uniref:alpha/beta fold hydrolase n=1 Tax=Tranquillimonas alkanivorans TaxID=441119 RepID=UPI000B8079A5|nr:alpha/beta hydrolase [Tranquillimonas alkanivorans]